MLARKLNASHRWEKPMFHTMLRIVFAGVVVVLAGWLPAAEEPWDHPFRAAMDNEIKLYCALDEPPTEADFAKLEKDLGRTLPAAYKKFQLRYGAAHCEAKEEFWPRPEVGDVGPAWHFSYGWTVLGIGKEVPGWMDIVKFRDKFRQENPEVTKDFLPLFKITMDANVVGLTKDNKLARWSHETNELEELKEDFDKLILNATKTLKKNKDRLKKAD
jgi:hypothetical protein